ncbi:uncharacterized protein LOC116340877 isoform X2 [Contarinia nasturtii]|uniref:uncharacterized protein LOC116340877 isoform X2 n=1 Tax=Contarinia nasturtii TaxID=265458 RepID=UPI0012D39085|nr:uncharacterized protein LOC116340877 isoform X2 [Contarinia nasturtii]
MISKMYSHSSDGSKLNLLGSTFGGRNKRNYKRQWNEKKRAGMSFLIVIAFFTVFALIILTEILMIDEKNKSQSFGSGGNLRNTGFNRFGESIPDYEDVKDEYGIEDAVFLRNRNRDKHRSDTSERHSNAIPSVVAWGSVLPVNIERTLPSYASDMKAIDGSWQIVNGTRYKFFVFSAFYDRRAGKLIRIIGATKTRVPEKVWCRFVYNTGNATTPNYRSVSVMARVKVIRENWNLKYSACFVLCPVTAPDISVPYAVSVVSRLRSPPGNVLLVRNTDDDVDLVNTTHITNIPDKIAVCVKPFHFDYDSALHLLEFLELNTLLGASHFTFYNHTLGSRASCVLKHYMNGDFLTGDATNGSKSEYRRPIANQRATINVLPWDLRMISQRDIRTEGLFAALNDCVYRNMYRYQHLALIDLDEFIIPRYNNTISELLKWMKFRINGRNTGAYSFQNSFFYLQFPDDPVVYSHDNTVNPALRAALITQRKTRRRAKLHPQKQRSKYICKPEAVVEAGNHFVWEFITGRGSLNVPADAGILHHYRVCEFGGDDCIKAPSVVDHTAHKYSDRLVRRVEEIYNQLKIPCNLVDLPKIPTTPPPPTTTKPKKISQFNGQLIGEITNSFTSSVRAQTTT